jgi:hypothetical protein
LEVMGVRRRLQGSDEKIGRDDSICYGSWLS